MNGHGSTFLLHDTRAVAVFSLWFCHTLDDAAGESITQKIDCVRLRPLTKYCEAILNSNNLYTSLKCNAMRPYVTVPWGIFSSSDGHIHIRTSYLFSLPTNFPIVWFPSLLATMHRLLGTAPHTHIIMPLPIIQQFPHLLKTNRFRQEKIHATGERFCLISS